MQNVTCLAGAAMVNAHFFIKYESKVMLPASVMLLGWGNIVLSFFFFLTLSLQSQLLLPLDICLLFLLLFFSFLFSSVCTKFLNRFLSLFEMKNS